MCTHQMKYHLVCIVLSQCTHYVATVVAQPRTVGNYPFGVIADLYGSLTHLTHMCVARSSSGSPCTSLFRAKIMYLRLTIPIPPTRAALPRVFKSPCQPFGKLSAGDQKSLVGDLKKSRRVSLKRGYIFRISLKTDTIMALHKSFSIPYPLHNLYRKEE